MINTIDGIIAAAKGGKTGVIAVAAAHVATSVTPTPKPAASPASPRSMGSGPCGTK